MTNLPGLYTVIKNYSATFSHKIFHHCLPDIDKYFIQKRRNDIIIDPHNDDKAIHNHIATYWNKLPADFKSISNKNKFKSCIFKHTYVFFTYYYFFTACTILLHAYFL